LIKAEKFVFSKKTFSFVLYDSLVWQNLIVRVYEPSNPPLSDDEWLNFQGFAVPLPQLARNPMA
jgi:hypothetical protein